MAKAEELAVPEPAVATTPRVVRADRATRLNRLRRALGFAFPFRKAVLAIFHDLNVAASTCDRIYALSGGRVVAEGSPEDVLTRTLLAEVYGVEAEVLPNPVTGRPMVAVGPPGEGRSRAEPVPRRWSPPP